MKRLIRSKVCSRALRLFLVGILVVFGITPAAFAEEPQANTTDEGPSIAQGYVEGEMLVVFNEDVGGNQAIRSMRSLSVINEDETENAGGFEILEETDAKAPVVVQIEEGVSVEDAIEEALNDPTIAFAQPNYVYRLIDDYQGPIQNSFSGMTAALAPAFVPNDPVLEQLDPNASKNAWYLENIRAFDAWDNVRCDGTVTVCVLDSGCRMDHEDLVGNLWAEYAYNAYSDRPLTKDYHSRGHGTHVAGLVAAEANNNLGIAGASYNARVLPICVFDSTGEYCYTSTLIKAYDYLLKIDEENPETNIHVVNMSLGGYGSLNADDYLLQERIATAKERDIITVVAGGNGDGYGNPITEPSYPSDYEDCVAVTALSKSGNAPTTWCDYNEYKDICAPGEGIYSTIHTNIDTYGMMDGTSMASPIVAGSLALLWVAVPELTVDQAKTAIYNNAKPLQVPRGREDKYGHGSLDITAALESIKGIFIRKLDSTLYSGQSRQMSVNVALGGSPTGTVWSVEAGTGTAEINSETGLLKALMPGTVIVQAQLNDYVDKRTIIIEPLDAVGEVSAANHPEGLQLSWTPNALAKGYVVMRAVNDSNDFSQIQIVENAAQDSISTVDKNVTSGEMYRYQVVPFSDVRETGTGVASAAVYGLRLAGIVDLEESSTSNLSARILALGANYDLTTSLPSNAVVLVSADAEGGYQQLAAPLAGVERALIVPLDSSGITSDIQQTLDKMRPEKIVVLGSEEVVPSALVEDALAAAHTEKVVRFAGGSISEVSLSVYNAYKKQWGSEAFVCAPQDSAGALALASYAYAAKAPILFSGEGGKQMTTKTLLALEKFSTVTVIGSESTIARGAYNQIDRVVGNVQRWSSDDINNEATSTALEKGLLTSTIIGYARSFDSAAFLGNVGLLGLMGGPVINQAPTTNALSPDILNGQKATCAIVARDATASDSGAGGSGGNPGTQLDPGAVWSPPTGFLTAPPVGVTPPAGTIYGEWVDNYHGHRAFKLPPTKNKGANDDGIAVEGWYKVDSRWYCMDDDGALRVGWFDYRNNRYYLHEDGVMSSAEWVNIENAWYYFYESGIMATNTWIDPYYVGADGKRTGEVKNYTITVTAKDTQSHSVADATLIGGAENVPGGTDYTVSAPALKGYFFKGWFDVNDIDFINPLSFDLTYTFLLDSNKDLVALYEPVGSVSVMFYCSNNAYKVNGSLKSTNTTLDFKRGEIVTVEVVDTQDFLYWRNAAGMKVSESPLYTFVASCDDRLVPEYSRSSVGTAIVIWESFYGQVIMRSQITADSAVLEPALPDHFGYTVTGWDKTPEQIKTLIEQGQSLITVRPVEVPNAAVGYTVTVVGGSLAGGATTGTFGGNDIVEATAALPVSGKQFSCWKEGDRIVSYNQTCRFYATSDMTLVAHYVDITDTAAFGVSANIQSMLYDASSNKLTCIALLSASSGKTMVYAGLVATSSSAKAEDLTVENADFVRGADASKYSTFRYTWTKSKVNAGDSWYVRPYLVYEDAAGTHEMYGSVHVWPQP